jgi:hypothetical protein
VAHGVAVATDMALTNKDTILIVYPVGGYGTLLEWMLNYYSGEPVVDSPFVTDSGSAHLFEGNHLDLPFKFRMSSDDYFNSPLNFKFARSHAITPSLSAQAYSDLYKPFVKKIVHLNPTVTSSLLLLHNSFTKTARFGIQRKADSLQNVIPTDPLWKQREALSFWFSNFHNYVSVWNRISDPEIVTINIDDFIESTGDVLVSLFDKLELELDYTRYANFNAMRENWLTHQQYLHVNQLCNNIIKSTVDGLIFEWDSAHLSLHDEAFVQWALRDLHKLGLRCYNLNEFPTTSIDLRALTYNV